MCLNDNIEMIKNQLEAIELLFNKLIDQKSPVSDYMTIEQAAEFLNLKKSAIYRRTMEKTIPFYKSGRKLMFKKSDLINFIEK
jgi:excisionase family DNA binding protein